VATSFGSSMSGSESDWSCPATSWVERSVLVFSNLLFLLPFAHSAYSVCHRSAYYSRHYRTPTAEAADAVNRASSSPSRPAGLLDNDLEDGASRHLNAANKEASLLTAVSPLGLNAVSSDDLELSYKGLDSGPVVSERPPSWCRCRIYCGAHGAACDAWGWLLAILTALPDMGAALAVTIISSVYHACSDGRYCTRVCAYDWDTLYRSDFTAAFQLLCVALLYTRDVRVLAWKWASFVICLVCNMLFSRYVLDPPPQHVAWMPVGEYYAVVAAACFVLLVLRGAIQGPRILLAEVRAFRPGYTLLAVTSATLGIYFQMTGRANDGLGGNAEYWWRHSLWHAFDALACLFRFLMNPPILPNGRSNGVPPYG
jgi:hypothetical protein